MPPGPRSSPDTGEARRKRHINKKINNSHSDRDKSWEEYKIGQDENCVPEGKEDLSEEMTIKRRPGRERGSHGGLSQQREQALGGVSEVPQSSQSGQSKAGEGRETGEPGQRQVAQGCTDQGLGPVLMGLQVMSSYEQASDIILSRLLDSYPSCCVERGCCRAGMETGHTGGRRLSGPTST